MNGGIVSPAVDILYENSHSSNIIILLLSVLIFFNKRALENSNLTKPGFGQSPEQIYFMRQRQVKPLRVKKIIFISVFDQRHIFVDVCL